MVNADSIRITPDLLALISELDEFKGAWRALGALAPERLNALRHTATIESIGSSTRIGGCKLSDREVEQLLGRLDLGILATRDEQDAAGYAEVMETVFRSWAEIPLTENHLKQLHRDLMRHSDKDDWPRRMAELLAWLDEARGSKPLHPLLVIAVFMVVFLAIHPFQDGNGRLSRILTNLLLLQAGYAYVPYSSLESVIEGSRDAYHLALRQTQGTLNGDAPDWQPWLLFFLRALQQQKRRLAEKVERERSAVTLSDLAVKILDYARAHGRVATRNLVRAHAASPNTLKSTFGSLVKKGLLVRQGGGRSTWYTLR